MDKSISDQLARQVQEAKDQAMQAGRLLFLVPPAHREEAVRIFVETILSASGAQTMGMIATALDAWSKDVK